MIRKESHEGIGFSVVELGKARHVFASAVPRNGGDLHEQARDALRTVEAVMQEEGTFGSIVKQDVYMKDIGQIDDCRRIIKDFYGDELPATTYIAQAPCEGKLLAIEALGVGRGTGDVQIERCSDQTVVTSHAGVSWVHCAQVTPAHQNASVYDRSLEAFRRMRDTLAKKGCRYDQVIRTWLYLGDIVGPEGETQRYKELNRARADFYQDLQFGMNHLPAEVNWPVYPASTGIGTNGKDVVMSCIAVATDRDNIRFVPLENPQQVAAFDYGDRYSPQSPKFSRAMAITACNSATIFISGTASITKSETRYIDDVEGQTRQTLDNIEALISNDNFRRHGMPHLHATLDDLALVRVYVKRKEDFAKARAVCLDRLGEMPIIYAIADVCRPDLLVEIEGVGFSCEAP
jgi:enamine deaminase RidA (YjgF/YER057c/UK114 family)